MCPPGTPCVFPASFRHVFSPRPVPHHISRRHCHFPFCTRHIHAVSLPSSPSLVCADTASLVRVRPEWVRHVLAQCLDLCLVSRLQAYPAHMKNHVLHHLYLSTCGNFRLIFFTVKAHLIRRLHCLFQYVCALPSHHVHSEFASDTDIALSKSMWAPPLYSSSFNEVTLDACFELTRSQSIWDPPLYSYLR